MLNVPWTTWQFKKKKKKRTCRRGVQCSDVLSSGIWEAEERWKTWFGSLPPVFVPKFLTPWLEAELRSFPRPRSARLCMSVVNLGAPEIHPPPPPLCWRGEGKLATPWFLSVSLRRGSPSAGRNSSPEQPQLGRSRLFAHWCYLHVALTKHSSGGTEGPSKELESCKIRPNNCIRCL